jgi:protein involved in polysaccharide export with SLBB domain
MLLSRHNLPHKNGFQWAAQLLVLALVSLVLIGRSAHAQADGKKPAPDSFDLNDYRIVSRDQIKFQVTGELDDPLIERVSSAGEVSIPLLGAVKIGGLSLRQAESLIEDGYRRGGYFLKPQVILSFESYAPRSVSVLGQVNNPSSVDFAIEKDDMGIVSAITKAGGFTRVARTDQVKVTRNIDGKDTTLSVNVAAYLDETSKVVQFKLQPDDIIFVPERVF